MSDEPFITHRSLLFTVAYEMLGSAVDAEDVVQETWLRWAGVDQARVRDPRAYLVQIRQEPGRGSPDRAPCPRARRGAAAADARGPRPASGGGRDVHGRHLHRGPAGGMPGVRIYAAGGATAVSLAVEDGRISRIYAIRNPDKLGWLEMVTELLR